MAIHSNYPICEGGGIEFIDNNVTQKNTACLHSMNFNNIARGQNGDTTLSCTAENWATHDMVLEKRVQYYLT